MAMALALVLFLSAFGNEQVSAKGFSDVPSSHGFSKEINFLVGKGVISQSKTFGVNQKVTREEVAVMISKAIGLGGSKTSTPFKDVPSTSNASGYINSAVKAGIIQGYSDGTFRPKEIVNRGQMAIFIARAFNLTVESPMVFIDMSTNMASFSAVKKIVDSLITTGYADKTFRPNETLTRGQISAFIARAMQRYPNIGVGTGSGTENSKGVASLKGNITWQYNKYIGTRPDVGASVILFPKNNRPVTIKQVIAMQDGKIDASSIGLYYSRIDGFGSYELTNIPAGDYFALYISLKTYRNYLLPVDNNVSSQLKNYVSDYKEGDLGLGLFNHMVVNVQLKDKEQKTISKDWGYSY